MKEAQILKAYEIARERYAALGVNGAEASDDLTMLCLKIARKA